MHYPIAIEPGDDTHAYGVIVPDLPGCFSAGDTLEEAMRNVRQAIDFHLEWISQEDGSIPTASQVKDHADKPEFQGFLWAVVRVDGGGGKSLATIPHAVMQSVVDGATPARAWREYLGLSLEDMAGRLGTSQSAYGQQESSEELPQSSLEKIAAARGLALEQLDF
ncbi:type II toxin-antitoxin system HicB family antitoxin [Chromobacterium sp. IIBBL 290-4]|uniref:type II toxin-antitoxin system HicB family antitoxin n=1 Tax=Chromobacterium sp. IIBBL 290-4 TaxID=2953890 RepID=UPI0020B8FE48|nr:type II toxin-antitoxin system HicB family antitoxin [Chromobacterium sp. IIBBL 290-4]UTH73328.1 type II toxin-antitoxin system HicB family antitoxin [Chromobacterium sp. IIBBL 290-4]